MKQTGTILAATLLFLTWAGATTDVYAWGFRKKTAKADTTVVKKSRYDELTRRGTTMQGMFRIHRVENDW